MSTRPDLTGYVFGRLKVLGPKRRGKSGHNLWRCLCDCGSLLIVRGNDLKKGLVQSCGCEQAEVAKLCSRLSKREREREV